MQRVLQSCESRRFELGFWSDNEKGNPAKRKEKYSSKERLPGSARKGGIGNQDCNDDGLK